MTERLPAAPAPDDLPEPRDDELRIIPAGAVWGRLYFHAGGHPTRWDRFRTRSLPNPSRFDSFGAPHINGVLYAAAPDSPPTPSAAVTGTPGASSVLATCMAEATQGTRTLDRLDQRTFAVAELTRDLTVLDVSSDWATRAQAGAHLSTAPRRETSAWARAIATRWPDLHGVAYLPSTRPAGRALALWSPRCLDQVATSNLLMLRTLHDPVLHAALSWAALRTGTTLFRPGRHTR